jgi:NAD(P)-dependent dehydrogenase (short-subunit alcohol dehydrogenase family)
MRKTILITGSTDGIGLEAAKSLAAQGHTVLLHGRNPEKLSAVKNKHAAVKNAESYVADLSDLKSVQTLATDIAAKHNHLDVLINNAGVFKTAKPITKDGFDIRFVVNTIAPYFLMQRLLPLMSNTGRILNLSSAAQAPVSRSAFFGETQLSDGAAYAQSKLALTMWSRHMADTLENGPTIISVNPGSFLRTKMVKEAYGSDGKDIAIGSDILTRLATGPQYSESNGHYFDNDSGQFASPHPDAMNPQKNKQIIEWMEALLPSLLNEK